MRVCVIVCNILLFFLFPYRLETTIITRHKKSAGYGFITFETEKDAEKAAKELNHQSLEGREINVEVARPPKISVSTSSTGSSSNAATGEESAKKTRKTKSKRNNKKSNVSTCVGKCVYSCMRCNI